MKGTLAGPSNSYHELSLQGIEVALEGSVQLGTKR